MTTLTAQELEEIRKRAEKANGNWLTDYNSLANAVKAVDDVPKLLAEVERLREGMREIEEIVSDFYSENGGNMLPANLTHKAGEIRVIHSITLEAICND